LNYRSVVPTAEEYRLLRITDADRAEIERLDVAPAAVDEFAARLRTLIGTFPDEHDFVMPGDSRVSLAAFLATLPDIRRYHRERGVGDDISRDTLADLGQQLSLYRRAHGGFGLATDWWICAHWTGALYRLGRLQFLLHRPPVPVPGVADGEWVLGVHIPEAGPVSPQAVDDSLARAVAFFARHFPGQPVRTATLYSWLLDPYLLDNLPADANIVRFGRRFTPFGEPTDGPDTPLYFVFGVPDASGIDRLPRRTALQRLILDRIRQGGTWQNAMGYLRLSP
jgi:hypothetical protein